jgi:hypothetical protein
MSPNSSGQIISVLQLAVVAMLLTTLQLVACDEVGRSESLDTVITHVLELPVCRDPELRFRDSTSDVRFVAIVFRDGLASITRVTAIGRVQHCLASTDPVGPGVDKRLTFGELLPEETLAVLNAALENPPKESRATEAKNVLILRIRKDEQFVDKFYDRRALPPELRDFERLALQNTSSGAFGTRRIPNR